MEHVRGRGRKTLVRTEQRLPHRGALVVTGLEQVEPVTRIAEISHEIGQSTGGRQLGDDPQRQRKPCALVDERCRRQMLGSHLRPMQSGTRFTTFSVPREEMARRATQMLCERIEAGSKGEQVVLPCEPIEGETLGPIHPSDGLKS